MNLFHSLFILNIINLSTQDDTTNLKHILLWAEDKYISHYPFNLLKNGTATLIKHNCQYQNCNVTSNRNFFNGDLTKFDAIAFNGRFLKTDDLPAQRTPEQVYIFMNAESASRFPVCSDAFDYFFNMTATYRLDSDLLLHYINIKNLKGKVVGPNIDMEWVHGIADKDGYVDIETKSKAVAWIVSNCDATSSRMEYAMELQAALSLYGHTLDIYGRCGTLFCQKSNTSDCGNMIGREYYFYFSAENSFCEDYVSEKVLLPLLHGLVPIVYGGADYYRFLPPHSFIDARAHSPTELAGLIARIIESPEIYRKYFGWKNYYTYGYTNREKAMCSLCEALNKTPKTTVVYEQFRKWWYPNYKNVC